MHYSFYGDLHYETERVLVVAVVPFYDNLSVFGLSYLAQL